MTRVLVGGVGYRQLRDCSFGVLVADRLAGRQWPSWVAVEDLSYSPVAVVQRLEDEPPGRRFGRAVFAAAAPRGRAAPGPYAYRWDGALPDPDRIQAAVAEAVTGVIDLDNLLFVTRYFGTLPRHVVLVEIEPLVEAFGDELSEPVGARLDEACELVARAALDRAFADTLPEAPLGGGHPRSRAISTRESDGTIRLS